MTKVAVLKGGLSAEREVSLNTGAQVSAALGEEGFEVTQIDSAEENFIEQLRSASPDVVFICLHGRFGEDGTVQGLLELLGIPYVGSGVLSSALAMDKLMSKKIYACAGIPTPGFVHLQRGVPFESADLEEILGLKVVVKPSCEGSSVGMTIVHGPGELDAAIEKAFACDRDVIVEEFVPGVEVTVAVLGNERLEALPTIQVVPEHEFYDYESKYLPGMSRHIIPAEVDAEINERCSQLALDAHRALGCRGMSRTDTIVTPEGEVLVLETNTIPGMTKTSLLPDAAAAAGIEFPALCRKLVELALAPR